jgi:DNA polymerase-3 subunit alpha
MGKKVPEEIERLRISFLEGAKKKGIEKRIANKIYDRITYFGGYGFNKSHATAYALVAYQTAYLKANYPLEYLAALLTSEIGRSAVEEESKNKIAEYITEAKKEKINILPPDIKKSFPFFSVEGEEIRYALGAIKNVGAGAAEYIVKEREKGGEFKSWSDFLKRMDSRQVNRKVLESLIKSGACDCFGKTRATLYAHLEKVGEKLSSRAETRQIVLFEDLKESPLEEEIEDLPEWPEHTLLSFEKEVLGLYISGHPLARWSRELAL